MGEYQDEQGTPLAPEQRQVLRHAAMGLTSDQIATRLGISRDEARSHLVAAVAALGACSKLEAVLIALRRGLIQLP